MSKQESKLPSALEQLQNQRPGTAHFFRLLQLGGQHYVIPPPGTPPLPLRPQAVWPGGVPEGTFEIEYYDEEKELLDPVEPGRPATLIVRRAIPAPSGSASMPEPHATDASTTRPNVPASSPTVAAAASASETVAALPDPEGRQSSEDWNKSILHRQHVELRELLMEDFTHLIKIRNKLREEMKTWGDERNELQHKLLQQSQRLVDIHAEIVEQREQDTARRKQEIENQIDGRPKADYTQLGLGLLSTVEGVVTAIATRGKKKKAGAKAQQILASLLRYTNPAELQDLLDNPQAAEAFAQRMAQLTGKKLPLPKPPATGAERAAAPASRPAASTESAAHGPTTAAAAATQPEPARAEERAPIPPSAVPPGQQDRMPAP